MKEELGYKGTFQDPNDKTIKSVFKSTTGIIEATLLMNKSSRNSDVFCIPTHHYCNLGCKMCHLTKEGSTKPMIQIDTNNLIEAITRTAHNSTGERRTKNKNGWLSFMGVGEPLLNLPLIKDIFDDEDIIKRNCNYDNLTYALSTMMPNRNLEEFSDYVNNNNIPLKVHFSMHSPFTKERLDLLPSTRITIEESLDLLFKYREKIKNNNKISENFLNFHSDSNPVEIHYTLIDGVNDLDRHLNKVIELEKKYQIPFKILTFNPTGDMKRSPREEHWIRELKCALPELKIKLYNPPGHKVGSSCGEFTKHYYLSELESEEEKKEFLEWDKRYRIE